MSQELPPLPMPDKQGCEDDPIYGIQPVDYYTAEQMQAYARQAIAADRRKLAEDCDEAANGFGHGTPWAQGYVQGVKDIATGIRGRVMP